MTIDSERCEETGVGNSRVVRLAVGKCLMAKALAPAMAGGMAAAGVAALLGQSRSVGIVDATLLAAAVGLGGVLVAVTILSEVRSAALGRYLAIVVAFTSLLGAGVATWSAWLANCYLGA